MTDQDNILQGMLDAAGQNRAMTEPEIMRQLDIIRSRPALVPVPCPPKPEPDRDAMQMILSATKPLSMLAGLSAAAFFVLRVAVSSAAAVSAAIGVWVAENAGIVTGVAAVGVALISFAGSRKGASESGASARETHHHHYYQYNNQGPGPQNNQQN